MMRPFLDSTDISGDGPELARRADRDGYLFVRGLLPAALLEDLRMRLLEIARAGGWVKPATPLEDAVADLNGFCLEPERKYMQTYEKMYRLQEFHSLQHHPNLISFFERLLDSPVLPHPRLIGRTVFPRKEQYTTPPHQDFIPIQGTANTFTAWFPLTDLPPEMGGLQLSAGSHTRGIYNFEAALGAGGMAVTDDLGDNWVNNPMKQGDVVIFHSMTVHQGVPSKSDRLRMSMDARYQRVDETIAPGSLLPHTQPDMTWEDVYEGWPDSDLKYFWKKHDLSIKLYDNQYHERRDQGAFEMAERGDIRARSVLQRIISRDTDAAKRQRAGQLLVQLDAANPS